MHSNLDNLACSPQLVYPTGNNDNSCFLESLAPADIHCQEEWSFFDLCHPQKVRCRDTLFTEAYCESREYPVDVHEI